MHCINLLVKTCLTRDAFFLFRQNLDVGKIMPFTDVKDLLPFDIGKNLQCGFFFISKHLHGFPTKLKAYFLFGHFFVP